MASVNIDVSIVERNGDEVVALGAIVNELQSGCDPVLRILRM